MTILNEIIEYKNFASVNTMIKLETLQDNGNVKEKAD